MYVQIVHRPTWLYCPFDKTFSLEPDVDKAAPILRNTIRHHSLPIKARLRGSKKDIPMEKVSNRNNNRLNISFKKTQNVRQSI
jgi:hypothetical protein